MSSPDRHPTRRMVLALLAGPLALAGCSDIRPLYGSIDGASPVAAKLASVDIALAESRVSQRIRNELVFAFYGGGEPSTPAYKLTLRINESSVPVGVERLADVPSAYLLQLSATYQLVEIASGRTVTTGSSFSNASYDFSQQRFANVRSQRDAENRVANAVAADIRTKLAAHFATQS